MNGLTGVAIPLGAHILAVADALDALASARPSRQPKSAAEARRIAAGGAGSQWDVLVVAVLRAELDAAAEPAPALDRIAVPATA